MRVVVDDDGLAEGPAQARQILHKSTLHGTAGVSVEAVLDQILTVQHVQQWVCILSQTGCEDNNFKLLRHCLQETVDVGALQHVHGSYPPFNFDVYEEVVVVGGFEGRMD